MNNLENKRRNQEMRMTCIDMATRVIGKPMYFETKNGIEKYQDNVVEVAEKIYEFVMTDSS